MPTTNFPTSLDDSSSLPNPSAGNAPNSPSHSAQHTTENDAIKALEAKVGTGASTPANNFFLVGTGTGTSAWTKAVPTGAVVGTSDSQTLANKILTSPTINTATIVNPTLTVDAVTGYTSANNGTMYGIAVSSSQFSASALTDGTVTPAKLASGTGSSWAWQTWTTTWVNLTVGNGTVTSRYMQIGKTVGFHVRIVFGTTTSISGAIRFTLPVTSVNYGGGNTTPAYGTSLGTTILKKDSNGSVYQGPSLWVDTTSVTADIWKADATYVYAGGISSTVPFTWGQYDVISVIGSYEAA